MGPSDVGARQPPWGLRHADVVPAEPVGGLRSVSVRLGNWMSPRGFPWDVSLVRADWYSPEADWFSADDTEAASETVAHGPIPLAEGVPNLLLVPHEWAAPLDNLQGQFASWCEATKSGVATEIWRPNADEIQWRRACERPESLHALWLDTVEVVERASAPFEVQPKAVRAFMKGLWDRTPWLFGLSQELLQVVAVELRLPGPLDTTSVLLAARGARAAGWLTGEVPSRTSPTPEPMLRAGGYDALRRAGASPQLAAAFIDGKASRLAPMEKSRTVKDYDRLQQRRAAEHVHPMLIPVSLDLPDAPSVDFVHWADRWLTDGRAGMAIWRVFGRSCKFFRWAGVPGGRRRRAGRGLGIFQGQEWLPRLTPTAEGDYVGRQLSWVKAGKNDQ